MVKLCIIKKSQHLNEIPLFISERNIYEKKSVSTHRNDSNNYFIGIIVSMHF